jgi:hypothetical protein
MGALVASSVFLPLLCFAPVSIDTSKGAGLVSACFYFAAAVAVSVLLGFAAEGTAK